MGGSDEKMGIGRIGWEVVDWKYGDFEDGKGGWGL